MRRCIAALLVVCAVAFPAAADRVRLKDGRVIEGKVRQVGTVEEIRRWGLDTRNYELEVDHWPDEAAELCAVLSESPWEDGRRVRIALTGEEGLNRMLAFLMEQGATIRSCTRVDADLEAAFTRILEAE